MTSPPIGTSPCPTTPLLPRFYELAIDLDDGALTTGDVQAIGGTSLRNADDSTFPANSFKGEAVALTSRDTIVVAGHGDPDASTPPVARVRP